MTALFVNHAWHVQTRDPSFVLKSVTYKIARAQFGFCDTVIPHVSTTWHNQYFQPCCNRQIKSMMTLAFTHGRKLLAWMTCFQPQVLLPVRNEGFGISSLETILPAALFAGRVHTVQALPQKFPRLSPILLSLC